MVRAPGNEAANQAVIEATKTSIQAIKSSFLSVLSVADVLYRVVRKEYHMLIMKHTSLGTFLTTIILCICGTDKSRQATKLLGDT